MRSPITAEISLEKQAKLVIWLALRSPFLLFRIKSTDEVNSVAFAVDGKTLASGSDDNTVRLWDMATGKEVATLNGHTASVRSVVFSPDGNVLVSGSIDKTVKLWDVSKR